MQPTSDAVSVDFETFYDDEYSLTKMPPWAYVHHPKFDAYLVAIHGADIQYVGHPSNFDWSQLNGRDLLMHNAGFDGVVLPAVAPDCKPRTIFDTADCAAYHGSLRNLATSCKCFLGVDVDKGTRSWMKGKTLAHAEAEGMGPRLREYAATDARLAFQLWQQIGPTWPEHERQVSILTRERGWQGVRVDTPKLEKAIGDLSLLRHKASRDIPWDWEDNKTPLSHTKLRQACREAGIPAPASFAQNDEACAAWEEQYSEQYPWIDAIRVWRRTNMLLKKLETLRDGTRSDGTFPFGLKYFGAATGRWSGEGAKFNMQNLPRDPDKMFGVDLRSMLLPDEGHSFVIADLAQIEARLLLWSVRDTAMLELVRSGVSVYEAHARATMGWTGGVLKKEDPNLYALAKARVLGSGYGCGGPKFKAVAKAMAGLDLTEQEASQAIAEYRASNPKVVAFWQRMDRWFAQSAVQRLSKHIVRLPSGRALPYWNPRMGEGEKSATFQFGGNRKRAYGGLLTENFVQALARDVLVDRWLELERRGIPVRWTVHDETVSSVPITSAKEVAAETDEVFRTAPAWLGGCPIAGEVVIKPCYTK